jgi:hypothetical protein
VDRTDAKDITASIREIKPGEHYELEVTLAPPFPNGRLRSAVRLSTGVSEAPNTFIRVLAEIPEHVKAQPATFTIPGALEEPYEESVKLTWTGAYQGRALEATVNVSELSARVEEKEGQQFVVLSAPPGFKRRGGTFPQVTVRTDDEQMPTIVLPVHFGQKRTRGVPVVPKSRPQVLRTQVKPAPAAADRYEP